MIDHLARFTAYCAIKNKRKKIIVKKIFHLWMSVFGSPQKVLVDKGINFRRVWRHVSVNQLHLRLNFGTVWVQYQLGVTVPRYVGGLCDHLQSRRGA